ncbi:hypothetical protein GCM10010970_01310 [Silvimonas iriomotensis]|uniref:Uncharacterized protein n=2 Tax=Silvimonas iriomotensis TaxID=449662 RepID=A0ABQ2P3V6_9NEIS|nr:hypothetical protein GCM10010970_01310 [Silvimonas iriomotensis]
MGRYLLTYVRATVGCLSRFNPGVLTLTHQQADSIMAFLSVQYRTSRGLRSFDLDYDLNLSAVHVDSFVLQAAIQNEFPENISLRRITDFAIGETAEMDTIEAIALRMGLFDIQYLTWDGFKQIEIKHQFIYM